MQLSNSVYSMVYSVSFNLHFYIPISLAQVNTPQVCSQEHGLHLWYEARSDQIGQSRIKHTNSNRDHFLWIKHVTRRLLYV